MTVVLSPPSGPLTDTVFAIRQGARVSFRTGLQHLSEVDRKAIMRAIASLTAKKQIKRGARTKSKPPGSFR